MKKNINRTLILAIVTFTFQSIYAQNESPEIYLNHIYIVLDSNTYTQLFEVPFISEKLGNIKTSSHKTTTDSWSGKYLYGKNGYFEFFSTKSYVGATLSDCGLGFMTTKSNDILKIESNWKENSNDSIGKDTSTYISDNKQQPWFYSIYISREDSLQPLSTWLMENTPELLKSSGFRDEEIKNEIKWQDFMRRKTKEEFTKSFNRIKSVSLSLNKKEYEYFRKSLLGFGLHLKGNVYFNNQIKIAYTIDDNVPVRLKTVETELTEVFPENTIKISEHLVVNINGKRAIWNFTY